MGELPSKNAVLVLTAFMLSIIFLLFFNFEKSHSLLIDSIINLGHVPLFMVVAAMVLWVLDWQNWPVTKLKNYILAGLITCVLALITEVLQQITPERSFEINDIIHDIVGCTIFLLIAYQHRRNMLHGVKLLLNFIAGILLLLASMSVIAASLDELRTLRDFPLLASFETDRELDRWKIEERYERSKLHTTHRNHSLRVDLYPGLYPGASFNHPPRNWRGYDSLFFDVFLDGTEELALSVCIHDLEHNEKFEDRYNRAYILKPGPNRVTICLSEVEHAPKGRSMDMEHIRVLCIFSYKLQKKRTVYFDNFRLEKNG